MIYNSEADQSIAEDVVGAVPKEEELCQAGLGSRTQMGLQNTSVSRRNPPSTVLLFVVRRSLRLGLEYAGRRRGPLKKQLQSVRLLVLLRSLGNAS
jgi:hypothetical protein